MVAVAEAEAAMIEADEAGLAGDEREEAVALLVEAPLVLEVRVGHVEPDDVESLADVVVGDGCAVGSAGVADLRLHMQIVRRNSMIHEEREGREAAPGVVTSDWWRCRLVIWRRLLPDPSLRSG